MDRVAQSFYFATIREAAQAGLQRRGSSCWVPNSSDPIPAPLSQVLGLPAELDPFAAVSLGPLLGQGGSGHVYRGTWNGATVAVKVLLLTGFLYVQCIRLSIHSYVAVLLPNSVPNSSSSNQFSTQTRSASTMRVKCCQVCYLMTVSMQQITLMSMYGQGMLSTVRHERQLLMSFEKHMINAQVVEAVHAKDDDSNTPLKPLEAMLSIDLAHPNIIHTYKFYTRIRQVCTSLPAPCIPPCLLPHTRDPCGQDSEEMPSINPAEHVAQLCSQLDFWFGKACRFAVNSAGLAIRALHNSVYSHAVCGLTLPC